MGAWPGHYNLGIILGVSHALVSLLIRLAEPNDALLSHQKVPGRVGLKELSHFSTSGFHHLPIQAFQPETSRTFFGGERGNGLLKKTDNWGSSSETTFEFPKLKGTNWYNKNTEKSQLAGRKNDFIFMVFPLRRSIFFDYQVTWLRVCWVWDKTARCWASENDFARPNPWFHDGLAGLQLESHKSHRFLGSKTEMWRPNKKTLKLF